jgi:MFS family permease
MVLSFFKRIALILLGYGLAALASGFVVVIVGQLISASVIRSTGLFEGGLLVTMFIVLFAAAPAAGVVAVGEAVRLRAWWYYAVGGSVIGGVLGSWLMDEWQFRYVGLGFGIVAGLIFWAFAGRHAGVLKEVPSHNAHYLLIGLLVLVIVVTAVMTLR